MSERLGKAKRRARLLWTFLGNVSLAQWLFSLGAGGGVVTALRFLTSLPVPAYTGAGSLAVIVTGLLLQRSEQRRRYAVTPHHAPTGNPDEEQRLERLRQHLQDIKRVTIEEMGTFEVPRPGIQAGGSIRAGGDITAPGNVQAGVSASALLEEPWLSADRRLFERFVELLPSSGGVIEFVHWHDFAVPIRWETFEQLDEFIRHWDNAEHRFHDEQVDAERATLHQMASSIMDRLAYETIEEPGKWQAVVPAIRRDTFRLDNSVDDIRRVDELNAMATGVFDQHQRFIQVARYRLAI